MAKVHGRNAQIWLHRADLSRWFSSLELNREREVAEATGFRAPGALREYVPGFSTAEFSASGSWDGDAGAIDDRLTALLGSEDAVYITAGPNGLEVGKVAQLLPALVTEYTVNSPFDDIVSVDLTAQGSGEARRGVSLRSTDDAAVAAPASVASASQDQTAQTTAGGLANVHVVASDTVGGATDVIVQHSTDDAVWVDLLTVSVPAGEAGSYRASVPSGTTVERYVRAMVDASVVTSGNITVGVAFARR